MIVLMVTVLIIILFAMFVEIAAIALKLTGLNIDIARFQALSALTGIGYTSRETESIVTHSKRRKIVMVLMVLGPVGFLTLISMIMISIHEKVVVFNLAGVVLIIFSILLFTRSRQFMNLFHGVVEGQLKKADIPRKVEMEEVLALNRDFGVCEIDINRESRFIDMTLNETDFKDKGFIVLAIKRDHELITIPHAHDKIRFGDILFIYGNLGNIKEIVKEA